MTEIDSERKRAESRDPCQRKSKRMPKAHQKSRCQCNLVESIKESDEILEVEILEER